MAKTKGKVKGKTASKAKPAGKKKSPPKQKAGTAKARTAAGAKTSHVKVVPKKRTDGKAPAPAKHAPQTKKTVAKAKAVLPVKKKPAAGPSKETGPVGKLKAAAPVKPPLEKPKGGPAKVAVPAKPVPPPPAATATPEKEAPKAGTKPASKGKVPKEKEPVIAVMTGLEPLGTPARTLKRAVKERYLLEFYMNATPGSLYDLLSSPSGLSEWFCDDVDVRGDQFTFRWGNDSQNAQCLSRKFGELMRFQWETDEDPGSYFELRIRIDTMTNETCLVVTDHAWPGDLEESKALWQSQIHTLQRVLGA